MSHEQNRLVRKKLRPVLGKTTLLYGKGIEGC
jgi:hypothetical protein